MTAVDTKGITSYLRGFIQKIAFEMTGDKYSEIFNGKVDVIGNNPGHGFANVTVKPDGVTGTFRMNLPYEVQCTYPYGDKDSARDIESEFLQKVKDKFEYSEGQYVKVSDFPKRIEQV